MSGDGKVRCAWCLSDSLYIDYHDNEWGVPCFEDTKLYEFIVLEGAQAGLSWITILNKREAYRKAFDNYDYEKIEKYESHDVKRLLANPNIVRNELKIKSAINNAIAFKKVVKTFFGLLSNNV